MTYTTVNAVLMVSSETYEEIRDQLRIAGQSDRIVIENEGGELIEYINMEDIYLTKVEVVEVKPDTVGESGIG